MTSNEKLGLGIVGAIALWFAFKPRTANASAPPAHAPSGTVEGGQVLNYGHGGASVSTSYDCMCPGGTAGTWAPCPCSEDGALIASPSGDAALPDLIAAPLQESVSIFTTEPLAPTLEPKVPVPSYVKTPTTSTRPLRNVAAKSAYIARVGS